MTLPPYPSISKRIRYGLDMGDKGEGEDKVKNYKVKRLALFFLAHPLQGAKKKEFAYFIKVANLMKLKAHLTKEGLEEIRAIKSGMNFQRS